MILKELKPKYKTLEILEDSNSLNLLSAPQVLDFDVAVGRLGDRKIIYSNDNDSTKRTEILIENLEQHKKRQNFTI